METAGCVAGAAAGAGVAAAAGGAAESGADGAVCAIKLDTVIEQATATQGSNREKRVMVLASKGVKSNAMRRIAVSEGVSLARQDKIRAYGCQEILLEPLVATVIPSPDKS